MQFHHNLRLGHVVFALALAASMADAGALAGQPDYLPPLPESVPAPTPLPTPTPPPPPVTETIEPGLTLTRQWLVNPDGPVAMYIVRANNLYGWRPQIAPANTLVLKRAPVTAIAKQYAAPVAVNGGYFAFEGAAVGAVKLANEWIRLPWGNRTAIGFDGKGHTKIESITGVASVRFGTSAALPLDNLNGFPAPGTLCLLTPRYGASYKLKPDQTAIEVDNGKVIAKKDAGETLIAPTGWTLVAGTTARALLDNVAVDDRAAWNVETTPAEWSKCPDILGAGPRLLRDGEIETTEVAEKFRPDVVWRGPRTAVGVDGKGNLVLVVVDGRQATSVGLKLPDLALQMQMLGLRDALSFDGGSSAVLVVKDTIINRPSQGKEVYVANALLLQRTAVANLPKPRVARKKSRVAQLKSRVAQLKSGVAQLKSGVARAKSGARLGKR